MASYNHFNKQTLITKGPKHPQKNCHFLFTFCSFGKEKAEEKEEKLLHVCGIRTSEISSFALD